MNIGKPERETQNRVIALFRDELHYRYLGDWTDRENSNIEEGLLKDHLQKSGYSTTQINRALDLFRREADNCISRACRTGKPEHAAQRGDEKTLWLGLYLKCSA